LPPVDLDQAGWTRWSGQAVWRSGADRPAIAGDVILARHESGDVLVHFSKAPFPIFTARTAGSRWSIEFIERGQSHSGSGKPPKRFVWFYVPGLLEGEAAPGRWQVEHDGDQRWSFLDEGSHESIRLILDR